MSNEPPALPADLDAASPARDVRGLDVSSRAGLLLGAWAIGRSYQPMLLSRNTLNQAIVTGAAAASAYGYGSMTHSFLRSVADRLPTGRSSDRGRVVTGLVVDAATAALGAAGVAALPWREHERPGRALARLTLGSMGAAAATGLVADALEVRRNRPGSRWIALGVALATAGASYVGTRPRTLLTGAAREDGSSSEDTLREVRPGIAVASGAGITVALLGVARLESALSSGWARVATAVLGGDPTDHRTIGRFGAFATSAAAGWTALTLVNRQLTTVGEATEVAHDEAPTLPEVTGSPQSLSPWSSQSREGRRWLSMVLLQDHIAQVMQEPARQPIRVYASLSAAPTPYDRAQLLLAEVDRTKALQRKAFALFSPTGSGYVNYVASETFEYLMRGDCASACIEYSVLPSPLSLNRVATGTHQTRMVLDGIVERLLAMPEDERPLFLMFGESLGSQVSQEMFRGTWVTGPAGIKLDYAVWIGTPAATEWRKELWGDRSVAVPPKVGPGRVFLPRAIPDWFSLTQDERDQVRYLLLQNGDDPIPKFEAPLLWRKPPWLGPEGTRPPGAPRGTTWQPVTTLVATFMDVLNALTPTPGVFQEGGHDYRLAIPEALRQVWQLSATDEQMSRVQAALRERELGWELRRQWGEAAAKVDSAERAKAEAEVLDKARTWTGQDVDAAGLEKIIDDTAQPG